MIIHHPLMSFQRPRDDGPRHKNPDMKKAIHAKKIKEKHRKQHNVHGGTPESNDLDLDLEGADEKFLQQRRLQLQRELRLQLKREKSTGVKQPKKIIKKVTINIIPKTNLKNSRLLQRVHRDLAPTRHPVHHHPLPLTKKNEMCHASENRQFHPVRTALKPNARNQPNPWLSPSSMSKRNKAVLAKLKSLRKL